MNFKKGIILGVICLTLVGCKEYKQEKFVDITPSQSAILIPLEENSVEGQAKLGSIEAIEKNKVSAKRVQLKQRFLKTGRLWFNGTWIPSELLVIVERKPVTRLWTNEGNTGTSRAMQGIVTESDSIGYSMPITATAKIDDVDTALFLYSYNNMPLEEIMDSEIRNRVSSVINEITGKMTLQEAIQEKDKIINGVREDVVPFFKEKGITITTLGISGQYTYLEASIQEAINRKFVEERQKEAQIVINQRLEAETESKNKIELSKAENDNAIILLNAETNAEAIKKQQETIKYTIELKKIEAENKRTEQWNGVLPQYNLGGGEGNNTLFNLN